MPLFAWPELLIFLFQGLALCLLLGAVANAWVLTHPPRRGFAYAVSRSLPSSPTDVLREDGSRRVYSEWTFTSRGVHLPVWDCTGDDAHGPLVIATHGWGGSRVTGMIRLNALARSASRVVLWDLPGHGEAPGICRLGTAEVRDLIALIGALRSTRDSGARALVLYGWSLGGGVAISAGAACPVDAVIAESPYRFPITPARNVMRARAMPQRLTLPLALTLLGLAFGRGFAWILGRCDPAFDRAGLAARLTCPLEVIHGDRDAICPLDDGRAIVAGAPVGTLRVITDAGHDDLWTDERFRQAVADLVAAAVGRAARRSPLAP
ncbi:MAG: alpha/beta hydrolase [Phycisphaerae bacterium]|nr:alpha/beta hydrolase [Phycisphaerae bacterium]